MLYSGYNDISLTLKCYMPKTKPVEKIKNDPLVEMVEVSRFRINRMMASYLKNLASSGLYGTQITDVIRVMVYESVRELVRNKQLAEIPYDSEIYGPKFVESGDTQNQEDEEITESDENQDG